MVSYLFDDGSYSALSKQELYRDVIVSNLFEVLTEFKSSFVSVGLSIIQSVVMTITTIIITIVQSGFLTDEDGNFFSGIKFLL